MSDGKFDWKDAYLSLFEFYEELFKSTFGMFKDRGPDWVAEKFNITYDEAVHFGAILISHATVGVRFMVLADNTEKGYPSYDELTICPVCKKPIDKTLNWELILEIHGDIISIADRGVEAMTEQQQVLYHNLVHAECYYKLE